MKGIHWEGWRGRGLRPNLLTHGMGGVSSTKTSFMRGSRPPRRVLRAIICHKRVLAQWGGTPPPQIKYARTLIGLKAENDLFQTVKIYSNTNLVS